ncbi:aminoglycoside phosphotransferase [Shewanella sediminis HAW-EB3]|uniref:Aminoglycoside phosphotransferase n=1 Tax=Shewanella sediminis (strain HAW-EB3) TaxID=425104 RepID=A8FWY3_SHESH|nr:phosphotransferase [Shewanella sediminis]ABV37356.1 aminoglycoside phosphotransferase [Shewanella sediminis HAW-EB3]
MNPEKRLHAVLSASVIDELKLAGLNFTSESVVTPLVHGLSNQNYLINDGERNWVLRVNSSASSQLCDRQSEVRNWNIAAKQGLAPKLIYVSPDHAYYLSEYIQQAHQAQWGSLLTAKPAHPLIDDATLWPDAETLLLPFLRGVSRLPVPKNNIGVTKQWAIYREKLALIAANQSTLSNSVQAVQWQESHMELLALENDIILWLEQLNACSHSDQYSHRDLNPHNLLYKEGRIYCIDFEYACSSHPLFDLAGVLSTHALSTAQRHYLIEGYLDGHPNLTSAAKAALPGAINIYWVFAACWSLLMAADSSDITGISLNNEKNDETGVNPHSSQEYLDCFDNFVALIG